MTGAGQRARIGRALLALCGHRADETDELSDTDWQALDRLAEQHRLRPFLHGRTTRKEIGAAPQAIRENWREAHRNNAITVLAQRRALLQAVATLSEAGIGAVALKGSALAWTVWPAPSEREMRDIDLLVAEDNAPTAYEALRSAGWKAPELSAGELAKFASSETHLPPLYSPEGVMCELHARVWGNAPLPGSSMPLGDEAGLLGRARYEQSLGAAVPATSDMLAHLVVHAACSHLLNVGPMALVDIDLLCKRRAIDWKAFWERAERNGYDRPAALVFALVERWRAPAFLETSQCPHEIEADLLDGAELLLVQDLAARKDINAIASLSSGSLGGRMGQHPLDRAEGPISLAGRVKQIAGRAFSVGRSMLSPETRRDGLATAKLQKWMEG